MKRITTLLVSLFIGVVAMAQTHSDLSNNKPNNDSTGYIFNFDGTGMNNCNGQHVIPNPPTYSASFSSSGYASITVDTGDGTGVADWHGVSFQTYSGDCNEQTIDMSGNGNIEISLTSPTDVGSFNAFLCDHRDTCADNNYLNTSLTAGDTVLTFTQTDWQQFDGKTAKSDSINYIKFVFREGGYGSQFVEGTYQIHYIKLGDQSGLNVTGVKQFNSNNSTESRISIYPNPATDVINVSGVENASISVSNVIGQEVASANGSTVDVSSLGEGMYIVSVYSDGAIVATKRVVVE